ncbi:MAG: hypothetical protein H0W39_02835 [Sphingomonas sp.]|nr:hypothetical protein [Sphingomonas sp.]
MVQPSIEEFLNNLYRMRRDCLAFMAEAEKRGDAREVAEFKEHLERVESMIDMKGGDPDAQGQQQDN